MSEVRVDLVTNPGQSVQAIGSLESKVDELAKSHAQMNRESQRAVKLTAGSYAALEKELKENQKALRNLQIGSKEFTDQKAKVDALAESLGKAKKQVEGTAGAGRGIASQLGSKLEDFGEAMGGVGAIIDGVTGLLKLVHSELMEANRRDSESNQVVKTREEAIASMVTNAGGELTDQVVARAEEVGSITGADVDKLIGVASSVASAGVTDVNEIVDISANALRSQGGNQANAQAIAGAAIDLGNTLKISVKDAFGVLFQTSGVGRPEDIAQLGTAAVRATAALTNAGVGAEKATEMFAATTLLTGDTTGSMSVSVANDLTSAFRKLQQEGVPKSIEVAGKQIPVNLSQEIKKSLTAPGQTLSGVLEMASQSDEVRKMFTGMLPNTDNVAFTRQIVAGDETFTDKLKQAADMIDLATAGARGVQQVGDVEGRRVVSVASEMVDAQLKKSANNQAAALRAEARDAFDAVLDRTNIYGLDASRDFLLRREAEVREQIGGGTASGRASLLRRSIEQGDFTGQDAITAAQISQLLESMQRLIDKAEAGQLSPREAAAEQEKMREQMKQWEITVKPEMRPVEAQVPAAKLNEG